MRKLIFSLLLVVFAGQAQAQVQSQAGVTVQNNHLVIDSQPQPQLFGAELQYFRLRGGYEKDLPREKVLALWNQALDRMVEAKMNTVSFYIPWDFHEYAEGQFDFTGTADEDHDGRPDYPARDLQTFFRLIENHGIKKIMVRPGPYINAEWGFLGFGAIPEWFHNKYPDSHMRTSWGWQTRVYDYHNPDLLRHTQLWFTRLYNEVLKDKIGPGKPIVFLQIDNETNYQWQSIYNHDYGPRSVQRYQDFLKQKYQTLPAVNQAHNKAWTDWNSIRPPARPGANLAEDQDWYRFSDVSLTQYLMKIRDLWENLGVKEPQVMFTLAESYNAVDNGLLPNYAGRNLRDLTGMMTVNLYPKTDERLHPLLNLPFKADLDVKSADSASDGYLGSRQEWLLGPEIQAGWWKDTNVEPAARLQTYLTVVGHGLKAFYVYYFNEGQNWDVDWGYKKAYPLLQQLLKEWKLEGTPLNQLSNEFWGELQARTDRLVIMGIDVRRILQLPILDNKDLYFDSPLDKDAQPRSHFYQLKTLGENLLSPYGEFLARALEIEDPVAIVKDDEMHAPSAFASLPSVTVSSNWAGGLLGYLLNSSINPRILFGDLSPASDFRDRTLVHLDTGVNSPRTLRLLKEASERGQNVINFLASGVPAAMGINIEGIATFSLPLNMRARTDSSLEFYTNAHGEFATGHEPDAVVHSIPGATPLFTYELGAKTPSECRAILYWKGQPAGYRCTNEGRTFSQLGVDFFKAYNSEEYGYFRGLQEQKVFLQTLLKPDSKAHALQLNSTAQYTVAFGRKDPLKKVLWVTVKTGARTAQTVHIDFAGDLLQSALLPAATYSVKQPLEARAWQISAQNLAGGIDVELAPQQSTVLVIEPSL